MKTHLTALGILAFGVASGNAAIIWSLGTPDPGRPLPEQGSLYGSTFSVSFVQEAGTNPLPGDPNSPAVNQQADDDYYFAGIYTNQVDGGPAYTPVGVVSSSENAVERAVAGTDLRLRYHFNLDASTNATDVATLTFQMLDLNDNGTGTGVYNIDAFFNGQPIGSFVHNQATVTQPFTSTPITIAGVNGTGGAPDDNYIELVANNGGSTARWSNMDYIQLDVTPIPEPSALGFLALAGGGLALMLRRRK